MIAAFKLVDNDGALWTFDSTIVFLPILKVFIFFGLAALAALVRFLTAREAHKRAAAGALYIFLAFLFADEAITGRLRAPT